MYMCTMAVTFARLMTKFAYFLIENVKIGLGTTPKPRYIKF